MHMLRSVIAIAVLGSTLLSCVAALSGADIALLHDAQDNMLDVYRKTPVPEGGGSPIRAEARGSFCAVESVLKHNDASAVDSKGDIACTKAP
jgi:hypothetical protein